MPDMLEKRMPSTLKADLAQFILLFALSVFIVYFTPYAVNQFYFLVLLLLFWNSKKDFFWIAFMFVLYDQPCGFFSGGLKSDFQRLPIYSIFAGLSLSVHDVFYLLALVKALAKGRKSKFILGKMLSMLLAYFCFSYIISILLGMDYKTHVQAMRSLIPLTMFFFIPLLLRKKEDYFSLFALLFPIMFFVLAGQFYHILFGTPLVSILKKDAALITGHIVEISTYEGVIRAIDSPYLNIFCLIGASFLAIKKTSHINKLYYYSIISICLVSMFLSATRGWIIAYAVMMVIYFFFVDRSISNSFVRIGVLGAFTFLILFTNPVITRQSERVVDRVMTMKNLVEGDVTAGGTLTRIDEHSPRVMKKFWESPVIGFGISDEAYKYADEHVGNQSQLLEMGIVGFLIFIIFILRFMKLIVKVESSLSRQNSYKKSLYVFIVGFIGLFIIHSSSTQIFGYILSQEKIFLVSLFFCVAGFFIKEAVLQEKPLAVNATVSRV
jgi:hypothetical protein